ncbi:hypothetical protein ACFWOJ_37070 [Streptomyces sp. NPDC058439]|uniref:hypothetical protein n=2 Tax=unclassified Streptomyces TaxID=2593676 RepID=UPI00364876B9
MAAAQPPVPFGHAAARFGTGTGLLMTSENEIGFCLVESELRFIEPEPSRRGTDRIGFELAQRGHQRPVSIVGPL